MKYNVSEVGDAVRKELALFMLKSNSCVVEESEHMLSVENVFFQCSRELYNIYQVHE